MRRTRYQFGSVQRIQRKRGPDIWVYRYTDSAGKKRAIEIGDLDRYPTKVRALKAAECLRMSANPDTAVQRGFTFGALLDRYVAEEMRKRFSTADSYSAYIRAHIRPNWQSYALNEIRPFAVEQWLKSLKLAPKSKGHIKTIMLNVFNCAMLGTAANRHQPCDTRPRPRCIQAEDESACAHRSRGAAIDQQYNMRLEPFRTMAWLSVCLGLEPSVLFGFQWGDVDFKEGCVKIQRGVVCNHVDSAKNAYQEAPLPLDASASRSVLSQNAGRWREDAPWKGDWVFASPYINGKKPTIRDM